MILRDYQQKCVDTAIEFIKTRKESAVLDLATGAGKSLIVAKLAEWFNTKTGLKVLCLAPSKELVIQNHAKFISLGAPASIYCASVNKSMAHNVVFGSPQTVKNSLDLFCEKFALIIIDECHGITPTIKTILEELKKKQKNLRVIGLSATPYRMGSGYIYAYDIKGQPVSMNETVDPYFHQLIFKVTARELIDRKFLTAPRSIDINCRGYDTSGLTLNKMGNFDSQGIERAFEGMGRLTSTIIADVIENSRNRKGVIIFAATIRHAYEIIESLPRELSRVITGTTAASERDLIIEQFKNQVIKYLVNVAVLTTGFDAPHVDHVVLMRATESAGLMQQIIGRGLRLSEGKADCIVSDYAENIERHCPDGDLFKPEIKVTRKGESEEAEILCPSCSCTNMFSLRKNDGGFQIDAHGYFTDLTGLRIIDHETQQEYPAHWGRRCFGQIVENKVFRRCEYRWSFKKCTSETCEHENDIAARYCEKCKHELIDPNTKLVLDFKRMKADPYTLSTDKVLSWRVQEWTSQKGNKSLKIDYTTEYASFSAWYSPDSKIQKQRLAWYELNFYTLENGQANNVDEYMQKINAFEATKPTTITCKKNRDSGFYEIFAHNQAEDVAP